MVENAKYFTFFYIIIGLNWEISSVLQVFCFYILFSVFWFKFCFMVSMHWQFRFCGHVMLTEKNIYTLSVFHKKKKCKLTLTRRQCKIWVWVNDYKINRRLAFVRFFMLKEKISRSSWFSEQSECTLVNIFTTIISHHFWQVLLHSLSWSYVVMGNSQK